MKKIYRNRLPKGKEVQNADVRIENGEVIVTVEFKNSRFLPEDGDFVTDRDGDVFIYNGKEYEKDFGAYAAVMNDVMIINKIPQNEGWVSKKCCRFATSDEKSNFLELAKKQCGMIWNEDKKHFEVIR